MLRTALGYLNGLLPSEYPRENQSWVGTDEDTFPMKDKEKVNCNHRESYCQER